MLSGVAQYAAQALEHMEPEELVTIAQGFWHGLTDGRGIEGLLGFSPVRALSGAWEKARSAPPRPPTDAPAPTNGDEQDPPDVSVANEDPEPLT